MKKIFIIITVLFILTIQSCKKYDAFGREILFEEIYKAHWLLGEWQKEDSLGVLKEIWAQKDDSTYTGISYYIKGKDTIHKEVIELMEDKEVVIYKTIIQGQNGGNPILMQMTKDTDSLLVFENPINEHPQKVEYKLIDKNNIVCKITGVQNGKKLVDAYNFSKVDSVKADKNLLNSDVYQKIFFIIIGVFIILTIPLIAMQFTNEVNWTVFDFIVAGVLLFGTGLVIDFVLSKVKSSKHRILICGIILLWLFLLWAELAVGIFESPIAGN